eukprot:Lankesteria_metandrocarpae@DN2621_c0_g1_i2.p1
MGSTWGVIVCGLVVLLTSVVNSETKSCTDGDGCRSRKIRYSSVYNLGGFFYGLRRKCIADCHAPRIFEPLMFQWYLTAEEAVEVDCLNSEYVSYQRSNRNPPITMKYDKNRKILFTTVQNYETIQEHQDTNDLYMCGWKLNTAADRRDRVNRSLIATTKEYRAAPTQHYRFEAIDAPRGIVVRHELDRVIEFKSRFVRSNDLILIHKSLKKELTAKLKIYAVLPNKRCYFPCDDDHSWYTTNICFPRAVAACNRSFDFVPSCTGFDVRQPGITPGLLEHYEQLEDAQRRRHAQPQQQHSSPQQQQHSSPQ